MSVGFYSASSSSCCTSMDRTIAVESNVPLHEAIRGSNEAHTINYLVNKTDLNVKDQNGRTPLSLIVHLICTPNQNINRVAEDRLRDIAILILDHDNTDPNIKDNDGNTPLSVLLQHKQFDLAEIFLSYPKTNPNEFRKTGHTEITRAIYFDDLDILEFLLSFPQTDPNLLNGNGELPLDLAIRCGGKKEKLEKVKLFLAHPKIVVATRLQNGETALSTAIKLQHAEIVNLLLPIDKENGSIYLENYRQLANFQKASLFMFSKEEINKIKACYKNELDALYHLHLGNDADVNADFVSYYAVEGMSDVDSILSQMPHQSDVHRIGFIDMDETLYFGGFLGWANECFHKVNMGEQDHHRAIQLLQKYGFKSAHEFADWGNDKFGVFAENWHGITNCLRNYFFNSKDNFCAQGRVIDSQVPSIFKKWHEEGANLFCLTARGGDKETQQLTKNELHEGGIDFAKLSSIAIEKPEKDISAGVIFCNPKFGKKTGGIQFLELYLEQLALGEKHFPAVEIIVVDNCKEIFTQIISLNNREEIQRLEQKFNMKITFKYFQPFEELWQSPHINWGKLKEFVDDHNPARIALQALQKFLDELC